MVLLKDFSSDGFTFFTNYTSRKGQELAENPHASICFYWDVMSRQIRIDGTVSKVPREKSVEYFSKRPLNSRISAFISDQSKVIKDKQVLFDLQQDALKKYQADNNVPCPENWGGYVLVPNEIEFWQGIHNYSFILFKFRRYHENK
jgi:pyridoxamine 5'-phosphate oxidase